LPEYNGPPTAYPQYPWLPREFFENQKNFPEEELMKYAGEYIASSWEGDRILASGETVAQVWQKLLDAGLDPQRAVYDYVADGSVSLLPSLQDVSCLSRNNR